MASTSPSATRSAAGDRKLQLKELLDWLVEDGLVEADTAAKVQVDARTRGGGGASRHPIAIIAEARLRSKKPPGGFLTADAITEWLAPRVKMAAYRIDPLKIDLKSVTAVMSSDYAQRRGILPVEASGKDVTIATS